MLRLSPVGRAATYVFVFCLALVSCGRIAPTEFSGDVDVLLARGESYLNDLARRPSQSLRDEEVLALGYAERLRLGVGSPFRLMEYALRDPDLSPDVSERLVYGLLGRTAAGTSYFVDPTVLDLASMPGVTSLTAASQQQLRLVERTIETAPTPLAGEQTVRLAYLLAGSERTVDGGYSTVIAHVAAMVGDRRRAREDATALLRAAVRAQQDPLLLLQEWRRSGRFSVEQPALALGSVREEEAEASDGPVLALALRSLAQRLSAPTTLVGGGPSAIEGEESLLTKDVAERLMSLAEKRAYPAQAPIAVAVEINREGLLTRPRLRRSQRAARERFTREAWNEERLVASAALLRVAGAYQGQRPPLVMLQASTFMRGWNQEESWFPGDPAPNARDLEARFGLSSIRFDKEVPEAWRPYFLRMLGRSLTDLQRVLPMASARGLNIVIGELPGEASALALHEPRSRTLYLPPNSGAGTLAHELAHDLDWQLALKRYGIRGGYATDLAIRSRRGDRIAAAMMELSASLVSASAELAPATHSTRPAEVFARGVDWLVAAMLARDGRMGGYLTSFQDAVLTGYGTTKSPDITGGAVPALFSILDAIAPVASPSKQWALERYGPSRSLTALELAHAVTEAGSGLPAERRFSQIREVGLRSFEAASSCRFVSATGLKRLVTAQRALAEASLEAALRGAAIDAVRELAREQGGPAAGAAADSWLAWRLYGAPEPIDSILEPLVPAFGDILLSLELATSDYSPAPVASSFRAAGTAPLCGGNPFAADGPLVQFRTSPDVN